MPRIKVANDDRVLVEALLRREAQLVSELADTRSMIDTEADFLVQRHGYPVAAQVFGRSVSSIRDRVRRVQHGGVRHRAGVSGRTRPKPRTTPTT